MIERKAVIAVLGGVWIYYYRCRGGFLEEITHVPLCYSQTRVIVYSNGQYIGSFERGSFWVKCFCYVVQGGCLFVRVEV